RVYPFEWVTLLGVLVAVVFLRSRGLRMDWRTAEYILAPLAPFLPKALLAGVGLVAAYRLGLAWLRRRRAREALLGYLRRVARPGWLALWLRLWLASMLMTYGYFWVKVTIPLVNPRLWDRGLWELDRWLHLGLSPTLFLTRLFEGSFLMRLLDGWYGWWVASVFYSMAFFSALPRALPRRRFMLSCILLWTLGAWLYMALPALGPTYLFPEVFRDVLPHMPSAELGQAALWENYQKMLAGREGVLRQFNPTRGIAALPSLHVGAHWLFALWARRLARPLWVLFVVATLLTFLGSILTGWHYAVDGYAGILLAWGCYRLALALERPLAQAPTRRAGSAPPPA
ncbi:MAG TPA: phosphatase PAP2 family protein, partial [Thermoanaerobaculia bacterium]|nr:phosphatase PAP2 family protein [Thermoanaerobaculia bacterium]